MNVQFWTDFWTGLRTELWTGPSGPDQKTGLFGPSWPCCPGGSLLTSCARTHYHDGPWSLHVARGRVGIALGSIGSGPADALGVVLRRLGADLSYGASRCPTVGKISGSNPRPVVRVRCRPRRDVGGSRGWSFDPGRGTPWQFRVAGPGWRARLPNRQ